MLDINSINEANKLKSRFKPRIILKENRISDKTYYMNGRSNQQLRQLKSNLYELLDHDFALYDTNIELENIEYDFYLHAFDMCESKHWIYEIKHHSFVHNFTIELFLDFSFDYNQFPLFNEQAEQFEFLHERLIYIIMQIVRSKGFKYICFNIPKRCEKSSIIRNR